MSDESSIDSDDFIWENLSDGGDFSSSADYERYFVSKLSQQAHQRHCSHSSVDWSHLDGKHSRNVSNIDNQRLPKTNMAINGVRALADDDEIDVELIPALEKIAARSELIKHPQLRHFLVETKSTSLQDTTSVSIQDDSNMLKLQKQEKAAVSPKSSKYSDLISQSNSSLKNSPESSSASESVNSALKTHSFMVPPETSESSPSSTLDDQFSSPLLAEAAVKDRHSEQPKLAQADSDKTKLSMKSQVSNECQVSSSGIEKENGKTQALFLGDLNLQKLESDPKRQTTAVPVSLDQIANSSIEDILCNPEYLQIFPKRLKDLGNRDMADEYVTHECPESVLSIASNGVGPGAQPRLKPKKTAIHAPWLPHKNIPLRGRRPRGPSPCRRSSLTLHSCPNCVHKHFYNFPRKPLEMALVQAVRSGVDVDRLMQFMKEDPGTMQLERVVAAIMKLRTREKWGKTVNLKSSEQDAAQPGATK